MKSYRFEIVRRKSSRYGWRVVVGDGGRERVLARSSRSYRSRKRARRAIEALQAAEIVDMSRRRDRDGLPLPATSFEIVRGALPLIVAERPVDYEFAARRRPEGTDGDDALATRQVDRPQAAQAAQQEAAQEEAAQQGAGRARRRTRSGGRARQAE